MSATGTENTYNLRTARQRVAASLGVDPANLSYEKRIEYNRALAGFILQYPAGFSDSTLATAADIAGRSYDDLADPSFNWGEFADDVAATAVPVLDGFQNKLLLIVAVAAVAWVFFNSRPSSPTPAPA